MMQYYPINVICHNEYHRGVVVKNKVTGRLIRDRNTMTVMIVVMMMIIIAIVINYY